MKRYSFWLRKEIYSSKVQRSRSLTFQIGKQRVRRCVSSALGGGAVWVFSCPFTAPPRFSTDTASTGSPGGTPVSCHCSPVQKPAPPTAPRTLPPSLLRSSAQTPLLGRLHGHTAQIGDLTALDTCVGPTATTPPTPPSAVPGNPSSTRLDWPSKLRHRRKRTQSYKASL